MLTSMYASSHAAATACERFFEETIQARNSSSLSSGMSWSARQRVTVPAKLLAATINSGRSTGKDCVKLVRSLAAMMRRAGDYPEAVNSFPSALIPRVCLVSA